MSQDKADSEQEWSAEDQAEFDRAIDEIFDLLFDKAERGEITLAQVGEFFPRDVKERCL